MWTVHVNYPFRPRMAYVSAGSSLTFLQGGKIENFITQEWIITAHSKLVIFRRVIHDKT